MPWKEEQEHRPLQQLPGLEPSAQPVTAPPKRLNITLWFGIRGLWFMV